MPVCSYLVIPERGATEACAERLSALPGCEVVRAENRDVLLLVTETAGPAEERALRDALASIPGIRSLVLTFGELDTETADRPPWP